jgi:Flp pilus assembly secretin CpaC
MMTTRHMTRMTSLALAFALSCGPAIADEEGKSAIRTLKVEYDKATAVHLDESVKTVVVGNASIAEALLVNDRLIYVQGRIFGNTNLIALDANGTEILHALVTVGAPDNAQVTLYRGNAQFNLACSPRCERTVTMGDADVDAQASSSNNKMTVAKTGSDMSTQR